MIGARALRAQQLLGVACAAFLAVGCAASNAPRAARPESNAAGATNASADSSRDRIVVSLDLRRDAELAGGRDRYRVRNADLSVEFRSSSGASIDAGELAVEGRALGRVVSGSGTRRRVRYRAGREVIDGLPPPGADGWVALVASGSGAFAPARLRVQLAPLAEVIEPAPGEALYRSQGLVVAIAPPPAGVHVRVRYTSADDGLTANEVGAGRYEFPRDQIAAVTPGPARVVIETDTGCGECPARAGVVLRWSTHSELEVPLTIFER